MRRSELKHIIPHQSRADFHVNGALAYELPFLKLHLFHHLPEFIRRWRGDDKRLDGYIRARRIHDLLASIEDVADDSAVPPHLAAARVHRRQRLRRALAVPATA